MARFGSLAAVAIGGIVGSLARWGLLSATSGRDELIILVINVVASIILGAVLGRREVISDNRFHLLGTGFAGGLSTFSTYAVAVAQRLEAGDLTLAAANGFGTMAAVVVAAGIGYRLSRLVQLWVGARRSARSRRSPSTRRGAMP